MDPEVIFPGRPEITDEIREEWDYRGVSTRLEAARKVRGMTQKELADAVGVSLISYRRLEKGQVSPQLLSLIRCAWVLQFPLAALVEDAWCREWGQGRGQEPKDPVELWRAVRDPNLPPPA
ncbi:MAG: helix-turn-helix transcriptional regulator [Hyphomicrobiaceae bacterium]|nr:MAG: helix-turn-helix transcriptional regulator [Hyphomicrobiaceae bacterium]